MCGTARRTFRNQVTRSSVPMGMRQVLAAIALIAVVIGAVAACTSQATPPRTRATRTTHTASQARRAVGLLTYLQQPGALAAGPDGQIYVADDALNEILRVLPGGRFQVIAGNGNAGFSGDGGPAVNASLDDPGGMAVTSDDELYFADTGNNRIRVISPRGIITTAAGDGRNGSWVPNGTPALKASLGGPADVAVGPNGILYIASEGTNQILELSRTGRLLQIAGSPTLAGLIGIGQQAVGASPDGPDGLAFNRAGDLYIAGFNTKQLLMISASGRMRLPVGTVGFYPRGRGGLVTGSDGSVLAINGQQVEQITSHGLRVLIDFSRYNQTGIRGFMPDGIAVTTNGTIYLDTWDGNGWASKTALIQVSPGGHTRVIWPN
jgi:hypothetical protein